MNVRTLSLLTLLFTSSVAMAASWKSEGPYFGNFRAIAVDPADGDRLWMGTNGGGVWQSDDGGRSWRQAGLAGYSVTYVLVQPGSPNVWAGFDGGALARTTDGGKSWKWISDDFSNSPLTPAIDPKNPKTILFPSVNLHHKTVDGGAKWTDFRVSGGDVLTFAYHPNDSKIIWAGGINGRSGLWKSTDGGASWKQIGKGLPEMNNAKRLLVDHGNPDIIYMAVSRGGYKSIDAGESWEPIGGGLPQSELRSFVMHPKSSKTLYAGTEKGFFVTTDGGDSWTEMDNGLPNYIVNGLAFHPTNPDVMWAGASSAGVYKSTNGGKTWTPSNDGFAGAWIEEVWGDPQGTIYAGTSRGLYRKFPSAEWTEILQPFSDDEADVDTIIFDRANPKLVHIGENWSLYRSTDGGLTWKDLVKPFQDPRPNFDSVAIDRKNPKLIYASEVSASDDEPAVFKSIDGGVKWKPASKGLRTKGVRELALDSSGALLALGKEGGLWKSTDAATTWLAIGTGLPSETMMSLAIDPVNPMNVFVRSEKKVLYRSEDGGANFAAVKIGKDEKVASITTSEKGTVFAGTPEGVWASTDGGKTWIAMNDGLANTDVRALHSSGSRLYAGTGGGSVFSTTLD